MKATGIISTVLFALTVSLAILGWSIQFALRAPMTYQFHFNDSQSITKAGRDVDISDMADAIAEYLSVPGQGRFQVYEKNGSYRDPVFGRKAQTAMARYRRALNAALAVTAGITVLAVLLFLFMSREELREWRFFASVVTIPTAAIAVLLCAIAAAVKPLQSALYHSLIGVTLGRKNTLYVLLGSGFTKAFEIFFIGCAVVLLLLFSYAVFRSRLQKKRIFY